MDVDTIEPGLDFAEEVTRAVATCRVLVAVIGPAWLTAADGRGRRRLDDPGDFVRLEIKTALARGVRVIPVLARGAMMPSEDDMPENLAGLARRNALFIRHESFRFDAGRLVAAIEGVLDVTSGAVDQSPPAAKAEAPAVLRDDRTGSNAPARRLGRKQLLRRRLLNSPGMSSQLGLSARLPSASDSTCPLRRA